MSAVSKNLGRYDNSQGIDGGHVGTSRALHRQQNCVLLVTLLCAALTYLPATAIAAAPMVVGNGLILACSQLESDTLRCDYRLTGSGQPLTARASIGDVSLPNPTFAARTGAPASVAVLLLVDTSDPARAPAIKKARKHIARLVNEAESHLRFGLAAFDSNLEMLAPIGSDVDSIVAAANSLSAKGHTTELYRNVVGALNLLSTATDAQKVLMVLSDGLAEDSAYFHADAVRAALDKRITVFGIGYARSVALAVGLQSLRRLADETGGRFIAADSSLGLPENFFRASFTAIENVGALSVDLRAARETLVGGTYSLQVMLETNAGPTDATVTVTLPSRIAAVPTVKVVEIEVPKVIEVEKVVRVPQSVNTSPFRAAINGPGANQPAAIPLRYWIVAIGLLAFALLVLLLLLLMQRRFNAARPISDNSPPRPDSSARIAYLTLEQDGDQLPHPISSATFRIGRLADNDLVIRDPSVSRHHAEIRRLRDGSFKVFDLDSMNGVFVNGAKIRESKLHQGDSLDVGDVCMRFSAENVDQLAGEETVMLRTAMPDQPLPNASSAARR